MKKFLILLFIAISGPQLFAQDTLQRFEIAVTPAFNYRFFSTKNEELNWLKNEQDSLQKGSAGFGIQINHEFGISEQRSFFMGIAYNKQGYSYNEQAINGFISYALNYHFLQFPLGANFYFRTNEQFQFCLQPSFIPGTLLKSTAVYQEVNAYERQKMSIYPSSSSITLHAQLAAGVLVKLDPVWKLRAQLFAMQQVTSVSKGDLACRLFSAGIQLALARDL
jgi:hypothetical protein